MTSFEQHKQDAPPSPSFHTAALKGPKPSTSLHSSQSCAAWGCIRSGRDVKQNHEDASGCTPCQSASCFSRCTAALPPYRLELRACVYTQQCSSPICKEKSKQIRLALISRARRLFCQVPIHLKFLINTNVKLPPVTICRDIFL